MKFVFLMNGDIGTTAPGQVSTNHFWRFVPSRRHVLRVPSRSRRGTRTMPAAGTLGMKNATVREVARRAGVSPMTVSRVVNGSRRVRPETRLAVEKVIAAVGYVPNGLARGLTSRKTGVLGLMVP